MQIFTKKIKQGVWDIRAIVDSGGMPSSHSALCTVDRFPAVTLIMPGCSDGVRNDSAVSGIDHVEGPGAA